MLPANKSAWVLGLGSVFAIALGAVVKRATEDEAPDTVRSRDYGEGDPVVRSMSKAFRAMLESQYKDNRKEVGESANKISETVAKLASDLSETSAKLEEEGERLGSVARRDDHLDYVRDYLDEMTAMLERDGRPDARTRAYALVMRHLHPHEASDMADRLHTTPEAFVDRYYR